MEDHSLSKSETDIGGETWDIPKERGFKRKAKNESSTNENPTKKQQTDDKEDSSNSIEASPPLKESTPIREVNNDEAIMTDPDYKDDEHNQVKTIRRRS